MEFWRISPLIIPILTAQIVSDTLFVDQKNPTNSQINALLMTSMGTKFLLLFLLSHWSLNFFRYINTHNELENRQLIIDTKWLFKLGAILGIELVLYNCPLAQKDSLSFQHD